MEDGGRLLEELGVLTLSKACFAFSDQPIRSAHDWYNAMVSLGSADRVREVSFRGCKQGLAAAEAGVVAKALCKLDVLQCVDLMGCDADGERLQSLLSKALPRVRAFADKFEPEPESEDEEIEGYELAEEHKTRKPRLDMALPPCLNLAANSIDGQDLRGIVSAMGKPLQGLCVLHLSHTLVDDSCLATITAGFPMLEELHLHDTRVELLKAKPFIKSMRRLRLLNCDNTRVEGAGADRVREAMLERRSAGSPVELEVWLRGLQVDSSWVPLLHFCASKAQHLGAYRVKHDLQVQTRRADKHGVKLHSEVGVKLMFGSADEVTVRHPRVVCTKTALQLAQEAISELNLVAIRDERVVNDLVTMQLRRAYRGALKEHSLAGKLDGKEFEMSMLSLRRSHLYNGHFEESLDPDELLGAPEFAVRLELCVDVKHKRISQ